MMKTAEKKTYSGIFRDGGLGAKAKKRFRDRRRRLMRRVNTLTVLAGVPYGPGAETLWTYAYCPTYQEPTIMYLTGINQDGVVLLLDPGSKESEEILFVRKKDPSKEFWDGIRFGVGDPKSVKEVQRVTGIKDVRDVDDFGEVFRERLKKRKSKRVATFWLEDIKGSRTQTIKTDHNWKFKQTLEGFIRKSGLKKPKIENIMDAHFELRLPLDRHDVDNVLKAQKITGEGFRNTLKQFKNFSNECEVQGYLEGQMLMRSAFGLSFPSIIASGPNATVLHYMKNDDDFLKNELVLLDFGVRWMTMHADISRTVPASGKFNPLQRLLYDIVLAAQIAVEKAAKAGITIQDLNDVCWGTINKQLDTRFHSLGGKSSLKYKSRPHGVSHLMGEQEHDGDPFRNYGSQKMQPGWMISNEPGLYGTFKMKIKGRDYEEELGIRIEDNLLITKTGCRNLSEVIPKKAVDIERIMASGK